MGKYSKKYLRGNWQEEDLQKAVRAVRTSILSTNATAIHYKVLISTLTAYLPANKRSKSKMARKTVLSPQQEQQLS
jgi:hypothetical protein